VALYDSIGQGYAAHRRPDPRIAAAIEAALGDAFRIANIGAGTGSYEPRGRTVIAVEPSGVMIRQRPEGAAPCLQGSAESLPLETASVDAAMTVLSAHHWSDLPQGLREMARVARERVVLVTWVPDAAPFWLTRDYFPQIAAHDRRIFPDSDALIYLRAEVRRAMSSFARIDADEGLATLRADLKSGRWAERNGRLLTLDALDLGYRIVRCQVGAASA
jgi:SAM-dependent methyltransferase